MNNAVPNSGTPRGFNLQNMMTGYPPHFASQVNGGQFPPFGTFGNHTVQAPQWNINQAMMANGTTDETHMAGPMRRGGGRFAGGMRLNGPYDRRQQGRFSNQAGMMGPVGNPIPAGMGRRGGFGGGGKWGDGAGAQSMGPKEAVQGRMIKKYDDLDATVEGGGASELNY